MIFRMEIVNESAWVESENGKININNFEINIITPVSDDMSNDEKKESAEMLVSLLEKQYKLDKKDPIIEKELKDACIKYWHNNDRRLRHFNLSLSNFDFYKWEVIPNRVNDIYKNNKPLLVGYLSVIKKNIAQKCAYGQVNSRDEIYNALRVSFVWDPFEEKPELLLNPYRLKVVDNPMGNPILDKLIDVTNAYVTKIKKK